MRRPNLLSNHLVKSLKKKAKARNKVTMDEIASRIHEAKAKNKGRLPHSFVAKLEKQFKKAI